MSSAQAIPASNRLPIPAADVPETDRTGSTRGASLVDGLALAASAIGATQLPWITGTGGAATSS